MVCVGTQACTELEFVHALLTRTRDDPTSTGQCRGPLITIRLLPFRPFSLDRILGSKAAVALLWSGYEMGSEFTLCAAHWLDLACLCWMRAQKEGRREWGQEAQDLLDDLCAAASWDPKEIVNMFMWQRARLT